MIIKDIVLFIYFYNYIIFLIILKPQGITYKREYIYKKIIINSIKYKSSVTALLDTRVHILNFNFFEHFLFHSFFKTWLKFQTLIVTNCIGFSSSRDVMKAGFPRCEKIQTFTNFFQHQMMMN